MTRWRVLGRPSYSAQPVCHTSPDSQARLGYGSGSCLSPRRLKCRYASVPYPSIDRICKSPPKYLAYSRLIGRPYPAIARNGGDISLADASHELIN